MNPLSRRDLLMLSGTAAIGYSLGNPIEALAGMGPIRDYPKVILSGRITGSESDRIIPYTCDNLDGVYYQRIILYHLRLKQSMLGRILGISEECTFAVAGNTRFSVGQDVSIKAYKGSFSVRQLTDFLDTQFWLNRPYQYEPRCFTTGDYTIDDSILASIKGGPVDYLMVAATTGDKA